MKSNRHLNSFQQMEKKDKMSSKTVAYSSTNDFKDALSFQIKKVEKRIDEYSRIIGEKFRTNQEIAEDDPDIQHIKEQIDGKQDPKKKKKKTSKKKNSKWFDLSGLYVYNGPSANGELELYFKAIESLKQELDILHKTKESLDSLIEKGLKTDLGCIVFHNSSLPEVVLTKRQLKSNKFSYESIIRVNCEPEK